MIDPISGIAYGPFGSTCRADGPKRFEGGEAMHDNPRPTEEEQELAQTTRMDEEEEQRSGYAPPEAADEDADEE
jgi:hypothetical protein